MSYNVCPAFYKFKIQPFHWLFDQIKNSNGEGGQDDEQSSLITDIFLDDETTVVSDWDATEVKVHPEDTNASLNQSATGVLRMGTTQHLDNEERKTRVNKVKIAQMEKEWKEIKTARRIMRVFEVEEHMGNEFMEELSRLHQEHLDIVRHNFENRMAAGDAPEAYDKRKSLPAYIYGVKLAEMVKQLENKAEFDETL